MERICSSEATLGNARYERGGHARPDHENEDRCFSTHDGKFAAFAVFDGHDGPIAVDCAHREFLRLIGVLNGRTKDGINGALSQCFDSVESTFFKSIQEHISEKDSLQARIPRVRKLAKPVKR